MQRTFQGILAIIFGAVFATTAFGQGAPLNLFPKGKTPASKAISRAAPPPRVSTLSKAEKIKKANAYFNSVRTMVADFSQIGANGIRTKGRLYVQKPGRLRFQYDRPATLEIIADGKSVAIRNRKTAKQDLYYIGQTPLKFLLRRRISLARDTKILEVKSNEKETMIRIEDKATFGGTSRIRLYFDPVSYELRKWIVLDAQGFKTQVQLANIDLKKRPSKGLFKINYERFEDLDNR